MKQVVLGQRTALKVAALAAGLLWSCMAAAQQVGTTVRVTTDFGPLDFHLYDEATPITVANFLKYVRNGGYDGVLFHRIAKAPAVIQGGAFKYVQSNTPRGSVTPTEPAISNEFSATRPNARGTIAMAKGNGPNTATNQWYINLEDNPALDRTDNNGGYTVFGRLSVPSRNLLSVFSAMTSVDARNCTTTLLPGSAAGSLGELPLRKALTPVTCANIKEENVVLMRSAKVLPAPATLSDTDRVLNYLEALVPQYMAPANGLTQTAGGYTARHYPGTNAHVGSKDGILYYLVPAISPEIKALAPVAELLQQAAAAGY